MIQLQAVSKTYGAVRALDPLSLEFRKGSISVLIGPSGCGKSTVIRLITRLAEPDSGTIHVDGQALTHANVESIRQKLGYVIQEGGLFPHLTAGENILLMPKYLKVPRDTAAARLSELCALTRFPEDGLERYPSELSGGQKQRISLMRALIMDPDALLLDEPLGALDPLVRSGLQQDLKDIFRRLNKTVVMVTHDLAEAAFLGDEIILLNEGRMIQKGTLDDLRKNPKEAFVTEFISAQRSLVTL